VSSSEEQQRERESESGLFPLVLVVALAHTTRSRASSRRDSAHATRIEHKRRAKNNGASDHGSHSLRTMERLPTDKVSVFAGRADTISGWARNMCQVATELARAEREQRWRVVRTLSETTRAPERGGGQRRWRGGERARGGSAERWGGGA